MSSNRVHPAENSDTSSKYVVEDETKSSKLLAVRGVVVGETPDPKESAPDDSKKERRPSIVTNERLANAKKIDKMKGFRKSNKLKAYLINTPKPGWPTTRWKAAHLMSHWAVRFFLVSMIVANACTIGLEADYGDGSAGWQAIEIVFLIVFTSELGMNLFGYGMLFWEDWWNWLDALIIAVSILDFSVSLASGGSSSALSVFRLVRILRVIRVISFMEKMVYLVQAFWMGMESVCWVLILWVIALYIFAVLAKGFFGDSGTINDELRGVVDIQELFGSIPRSMVTLVAFFTYDSSISVQRKIMEVYPASFLFFLAFMVVVSIGIMELMTSLFIDSLLEEKNRLQKRQKAEKENRRKEVQTLITSLFDAFDEDKSESLDKDELQECLAVFEDPETRALLEYVEIDSEKMQAAIKVADIDGDGDVSAAEFSLALESIHDPPMKADIREVHQRVGKLFSSQEQTLAEHAAELASIHSKLDTMHDMLSTLVARGMGSAPVSTQKGDTLDPPSGHLSPIVAAPGVSPAEQPLGVDGELEKMLSDAVDNPSADVTELPPAPNAVTAVHDLED